MTNHEGWIIFDNDNNNKADALKKFHIKVVNSKKTFFHFHLIFFPPPNITNCLLYENCKIF